METTFNKQETIKLIEEYYERLEGKKVKVSITSQATTIGLYEDLGCLTTITVTETMEIAGMKKDVKTRISKEELKKQMKALFALYEFDVKSVSLEDGVSSRCEGYGMMEHTVNGAYFNGITVNLEKAKGIGLEKRYK